MNKGRKVNLLHPPPPPPSQLWERDPWYQEIQDLRKIHVCDYRSLQKSYTFVTKVLDFRQNYRYDFHLCTVPNVVLKICVPNVVLKICGLLIELGQHLGESTPPCGQILACTRNKLTLKLSYIKTVAECVPLPIWFQVKHSLSQTTDTS